MTEHDIIFAGGTPQRISKSTHVVSAWHIPHGAGYTSAKAVCGFFDHELLAQQLQRKFSDPPHLAIVLSLSHPEINELFALKSEDSNPVTTI